MVHELAGEGMLILWSTSYLDEAEQCRDVLLMNEGASCCIRENQKP
ncbi:hypothetical protein ACNKHW_04810 [Shigella flexneri]